MNQDLKIIKKKYGEQFCYLCRELFPTLLEKEGLLPKLLESNFSFSRELYYDIIKNNMVDSFKDYIYSLIDIDDKEKKLSKTPEELLDEAGYTLYKCEKEKDIQNFRKYYSEREELCTFRGGRLKDCIVFFAVKKDVDDIKREDFSSPTRQDRYGTSVISIQFTRDRSHTLSIKNRYNHTVANPDATFSNNLDNIIEGLTKSFEVHYGIKQNKVSKNFEIPNYVRARDGRYYKYNIEINNIYYCPNNVVIENFEAKRFPKERYILMETFIIDIQKKVIRSYDENIDDSFIESIGKIEKIEVVRNGEKKVITITPREGKIIILTLDIGNRLISLYNGNIKRAKNNFLYHNKYLKTLLLPNLTEIGSCFLLSNKDLKNLSLPNIEKIEDNFLYDNQKLINLNFPKLEEVGDNFLFKNNTLNQISLPMLKKVGHNFLFKNNTIIKLFLPNLEKTGSNFLNLNESLEELVLPKLKKAEFSFMVRNQKLKKILLPNLVKVVGNFLPVCRSAKVVYIPNLKDISVSLRNDESNSFEKLIK